MSYRLVLVSVVLAAVMSACVLPPPVPDAVVVNKYGQSNVNEVFDKLNNEYTRARQEGLEFFAPSQFKLGLNAIIQAGTLKTDRADDMEVFRQLYIAEQQLSVCRQVKEQAEKQLPELLAALDTLQALSVNRSYPQEFDSLAYKVSKLVGDIEDSVLGKPVVVKKDTAREKAELLKGLHELEVKVVKYNTLNESQKVFKEVESIGGKSLAPKTHREAEQALQTSNEVIEKDVKDKAAIEKAGKNYEFAAFHALHVTRAVSTLQSLGRSDYEQYILDLEDKLQAIAQAFGYRDIRNHAIGEQIMVLTGLANRVTNEKNRLAKVDPSAPGEEPIDVGKLQAEYEQAQRTIQELNEQIARLQEKPLSDTSVVSEQETQLRKKVVQLEEEVSRLLLENNDLKSRQNRAAK